MNVWIYSLASVSVISAISLVGVTTITLSPETLKRTLLRLVSFAVGALFGDVFIHLLPEAYHGGTPKLLVAALVIAGIILFFILEKFIHWRHCHIPTSEEHPHPVVFMNLIGDGLHNLIDGVIVGASYLVSIPIGLATTVAVVLHEIPQEMGDFGILVHGGLSRPRALGLNFLSATIAIAGCLLALIVGPWVKDLTVYVLPITAGGFIYMAGADLIPELHKEVELGESFQQLVSILLGVLVMALLVFME
jgi:zinc and cadmium transporter